MATTNWSDKPCCYSWPDRNTIRVHVCIQRGPHEHHCGVCGPDCRPSPDAAADKRPTGQKEAE